MGASEAGPGTALRGCRKADLTGGATEVTSATEEWNATIERLVAATEDAREVIREAHGVSRDLRQMITETRQLIASGTEEAMRERLNAEVKEAVDALGRETEKAMRAAVERVSQKFDGLAAILTGTDRQARRQGKPPLEDLIRVKAVIDHHARP